MQIPYLKNNRNIGGAIPQSEVTRTPDESSPETFKHDIAKELLQAIDKKDFSGIKSALRAFLHIIKGNE